MDKDTSKQMSKQGGQGYKDEVYEESQHPSSSSNYPAQQGQDSHSFQQPQGYQPTRVPIAILPYRQRIREEHNPSESYHQYARLGHEESVLDPLWQRYPSIPEQFHPTRSGYQRAVYHSRGIPPSSAAYHHQQHSSQQPVDLLGSFFSQETYQHHQPASMSPSYEHEDLISLGSPSFSTSATYEPLKPQRPRTASPVIPRQRAPVYQPWLQSDQSSIQGRPIPTPHPCHPSHYHRSMYASASPDPREMRPQQEFPQSPVMLKGNSWRPDTERFRLQPTHQVVRPSGMVTTYYPPPPGFDRNNMAGSVRGKAGQPGGKHYTSRRVTPPIQQGVSLELPRGRTRTSVKHPTSSPQLADENRINQQSGRDHVATVSSTTYASVQQHDVDKSNVKKHEATQSIATASFNNPFEPIRQRLAADKADDGGWQAAAARDLQSDARRQAQEHMRTDSSQQGSGDKKGKGKKAKTPPRGKKQKEPLTKRFVHTARLRTGSDSTLKIVSTNTKPVRAARTGNAKAYDAVQTQIRQLIESQIEAANSPARSTGHPQDVAESNRSRSLITQDGSQGRDIAATQNVSQGLSTSRRANPSTSPVELPAKHVVSNGSEKRASPRSFAEIFISRRASVKKPFTMPPAVVNGERAPTLQELRNEKEAKSEASQSSRSSSSEARSSVVEASEIVDEGLTSITNQIRAPQQSLITTNTDELIAPDSEFIPTALPSTDSQAIIRGLVATSSTLIPFSSTSANEQSSSIMDGLYACCFCAEAFHTQSELRAHVRRCVDHLPETNQPLVIAPVQPTLSGGAEINHQVTLSSASVVINNNHQIVTNTAAPTPAPAPAKRASRPSARKRAKNRAEKAAAAAAAGNGVETETGRNPAAFQTTTPGSTITSSNHQENSASANNAESSAPGTGNSRPTGRRHRGTRGEHQRDSGEQGSAGGDASQGKN